MLNLCIAVVAYNIYNELVRVVPMSAIMWNVMATLVCHPIRLDSMWPWSNHCHTSNRNWLLD